MQKKKKKKHTHTHTDKIYYKYIKVLNEDIEPKVQARPCSLKYCIIIAAIVLIAA